jgi:hypothetical protein
MTDWSKVVTQPLGLAGFGLFLAFSFFASRKGLRRIGWVAPVLVSMAVITLIGGLTIAYVQVRSKATPSSQIPSQQQQTNQVQQTTAGPGSPAVQGVQGDVNISVDQSSGKTQIEKTKDKEPQTKKPEEKKSQ